MSGRDSRLSAEERAALANLEAAATADDPNLASRLRGSRPARLGAVGSKARESLTGLLSRLTHLGWWGAPVAAVGLALLVISIAVSLWLGLLGAAAAVAGLTSLANAVVARVRNRSSGSAKPPLDEP
jgi:hypothetical protein